MGLVLQDQCWVGRCLYCGTGVTGSVLGGPVSVLWDWCYRISAGWAGVCIVGLVLQDQCWVGRCLYCGTGGTGSVLGGPVSVLWDWWYRISAGWAGVSIVGLVLQDLDRVGRCQYCRTGVTRSVLFRVVQRQFSVAVCDSRFNLQLLPQCCSTCICRRRSVPEIH